jgi:hypothetical protein
MPLVTDGSGGGLLGAEGGILVFKRAKTSRMFFVNYIDLWSPALT